MTETFELTMGVLNLFKLNKFDIDTYERELNQLNVVIDKRSQEILKLHAVKKQIKRLFLWYGSLIYVAILGYLVMKLPHNPGFNWLRWFLLNLLKHQWGVLVSVPLAGYGIALVLRVCLDFLIRSRDKQLRESRKKQKDKITELKKITNFNTTNDLLTKYEKLEGKLEGKLTEGKVPQVKGQVKLPQKQGHVPPQGQAKGPMPPQGPGQQGHGQQGPRPQGPGPFPGPQPGPFGKKTIQDRLLDLLVGSEDDSIEHRYALICQRCFNHCGLAPPGNKDGSVKYICPYCKYFNGDEADETPTPKRSPVASQEHPEKFGDVEPVAPVDPVPETVDPVPSPVPEPEPIGENQEPVSSQTLNSEKI